jgi:hypothetical protein
LNTKNLATHHPLLNTNLNVDSTTAPQTNSTFLNNKQSTENHLNNINKTEDNEENEADKINCNETSVYGSATSSSSLNESLAQFESENENDDEDDDYEQVNSVNSVDNVSSNLNITASSFAGDSDDSITNEETSHSPHQNSANNSILDEEEDLEAKKRQIQRQAERLLRKNKKLRKNFALTADCMIANITTTTTTTTATTTASQDQNKKTLDEQTEFSTNNNDDEHLKSSSSLGYLILSNSNSNSSFDQQQQQQPLRKSQRKRQTNKKFNDEEYALEDGVELNNNININNGLKLRSTSSSSLKLVKNEASILNEPSSSSTSSSSSSLDVDNASNATLVVFPKTTLESEKKGELKLRIKRIITPLLAVSCENENNSDEKRSNRRKRNISESQQDSTTTNNNNNLSPGLKVVISNTSLKSLNELAVSVSPLGGCGGSNTLSPNTPLTRSALAKLKQQTPPLNASSSPNLVDAKLLPPPAPLSFSAQSSFSDVNETEENNIEINETNETKPLIKVEQQQQSPRLQTNIPSKVKTLAQLKMQIDEIKKRKLEVAQIETKVEKEEEEDEKKDAKRQKINDIKNESSTADTTYSSNIEKIVHELKLIGNSNGVQEDEVKAKQINNDVDIDNNRSKTKPVINTPPLPPPAPKPSINFVNIIKQHHQQQVQSLLVNNINFLPIVDTCLFENGFLASLNNENVNTNVNKGDLPSINSLILLKVGVSSIGKGLTSSHADNSMIRHQMKNNFYQQQQQQQQGSIRPNLVAYPTHQQQQQMLNPVVNQSNFIRTQAPPNSTGFVYNNNNITSKQNGNFNQYSSISNNSTPFIPNNQMHQQQQNKQAYPINSMRQNYVYQQQGPSQFIPNNNSVVMQRNMGIMVTTPTSNNDQQQMNSNDLANTNTTPIQISPNLKQQKLVNNNTSAQQFIQHSPLASSSSQSFNNNNSQLTPQPSPHYSPYIRQQSNISIQNQQQQHIMNQNHVQSSPPISSMPMPLSSSSPALINYQNNNNNNNNNNISLNNSIDNTNDKNQSNMFNQYSSPQLPQQYQTQQFTGKFFFSNSNEDNIFRIFQYVFKTSNILNFSKKIKFR